MPYPSLEVDIMKISNMAVSNVKGNLYRYIMYYLSNSFAVTAFFIFANFVFHPALNIKSIGGHPIAQMGAINGMIACQVIIVIFSVLFVGYSTSIFLKSRGKEFGLLSLYGMSRKQIKKYVLIESTIISLLSIATGILTGIAFSKLFLMAMEAFMDISLPFNISLKALGLTVLVFFTLFEVVSSLMLFQIKNKEIIQQLKSSKMPKEMPKFSKAKSILGVVLMVIGYGTAWIVEGIAVPLAMIPVILIVVAGTYFIFTQFSIAIANKILKNENIIYKKTNIIAYSQMIFKLQDTAKVLFAAAILGAITFTATETIYSFFTEVPRLQGIDTPEAIALIQSGNNLNDNSMEYVKEVLDKNNVKVKEYHKVKGMILYDEKTGQQEGQRKEKYFTMSNSDYNKLAKSAGKELVEVKKGEVVYNYPYEDPYISTDEQDNIKRAKWDEFALGVGSEVRSYKLSKEVHGAVMALPNTGYFDALILNDEDFQEALNKTKEEDIVIYNGIDIDKWQSSYKASMEIKEAIGEKYGNGYYSKAIPYKEVRKSLGMVLFIGFFIAFLFFIASGSIIYFKLFNEIKQDRLEYDILRKIGATKKDINKIITKQIGTIFFLPFIVSTLHSFFALKSLSNLLMRNLFTNGLVVMIGYLIFQTIYFIIIRSIYIRKIEYN